MEDKKINIEMEDMVGKTYYSIATWFNQDFHTDIDRQNALKKLSAELIQTILEDTFLQLEGVSTEAKVVKNEESEQEVKETPKPTGGMFTPSQEDIIINALKEEK